MTTPAYTCTKPLPAKPTFPFPFLVSYSLAPSLALQQSTTSLTSTRIPSRRPFAPFTIHGNNHPGVPPAAAGNAPFGLASLAAAASTSNAGSGSGADLSAFVGGFGAVTGANASPMFGGPSGSGFGGFPAIPSTSTAPSGLMLPSLPSTSAQAPDATSGLSNDAYLYLQQYAMLLNQQGAGNQGGLGVGAPSGSGNQPGSSFIMLNQGPPPPQQLPPPQMPPPQPSLLSVFQAQQQHPQPLDYAALADAQQRRQSASFTSPAIHQQPPQPPNQQLTLSALQALQQAPNAAFLQALMPPPPQPQPPPPPQQLFSDEFLLNELQRELSRREAAAIQAQQQAQQIQAFQQAIQQGVIPASQTQQLLALLQQQLRPQAPQPPPPQPPPPQPAQIAFATPGLGTPRPPMTPQMVMTPTLNPGLGLMHSIRPSTSTTPSSGMRFMGSDDIHKKLSQSSLMSMSASPHGASPPKRNSMSMSSSQPIPRKISMVSTPQQLQPSGSFQSPPRMAMASSSSQAMPPPQLPQQQQQPQPSSSTQMPPPQPMDSTPSSSSVPGPSTSASSSARPPAYRSPIEPTGLPVQPYYPTHFFKGTAIQMANGLVKQVENMQPEDFANSKYIKAGLKLSVGKLVEVSPTQCCKQIVVRYLSDIDGEPVEGMMTANCEYPFYEMDHGWSSYDPAKTLNLYGLNCRPIALGDKCFFLARPNDAPLSDTAAIEQANRAKRQQLHSLQPGSDSRPSSRNAATSSQRLNRKSIPPPLVMDGASSSASSTFQAPHPPPTERIISSSSMTPSSSTISAPAASRPRPVFNLESSSTSNPNTMELYSAPAAMDDLTVAGEEPSTSQDDDNAMEVDVDDTPGPSQPAQSIPAPSNPTDSDVILDFNI